MRGKLLQASRQLARARIIPAHAGQTRLLPSVHSHRSDHPRACGANFTLRDVSCIADGSSPRMRGKPGETRPVQAGSRIIPAHAGQTSAMPREAASSTDHPRACGANAPESIPVWRQLGSSPRMRGKHQFVHRQQSARRIIPAHAGQTLGPGRSTIIFTDHPRACGANVMGASGEACKVGSSPRMRGKRHA